MEGKKTLYQNLTSSIKAYPSDHTLYMGMSLRETIHKFKHKLLILLKLLLLEKRVWEFVGYRKHGGGTHAEICRFSFLDQK
jgi:hypothetical protein